MSDTVIKVENLSKQYRLGNIGTGTLRSDVQRFWANLRGKEDPTLKIGQENSLASTIKSSQNDDYVWALQDINFEVKQGEVLGIIGKNGAGKSTLLKILSQVTAPSKGRINVKGRIASLLEVGTGFHPELTGRENIFLNGAILGMTKSEIRSKFDEIVDFSGVAKYIDTPVKRYSSGMYVRLAFAVAAHLEPEILIVDEVLAVGDAEFQKKALGKMQDISTEQGRTVLFVSHNLQAVQSLCKTGILLNNGEISIKDDVNKVLSHYLTKNTLNKSVFNFQEEKGILVFATQLIISDEDGKDLNEILFGKPWNIKIMFSVLEDIDNVIIGLGMLNEYDVGIRTNWQNSRHYKKGTYIANFLEDSIIFSSGNYRLVIGISSNGRVLQYIDKDIYLTISDIIEKKEENIIKTNSGIILNQMKMYIENA